jgi:hypothetical protein
MAPKIVSFDEVDRAQVPLRLNENMHNAIQACLIKIQEGGHQGQKQVAGIVGPRADARF